MRKKDANLVQLDSDRCCQHVMRNCNFNSDQSQIKVKFVHIFDKVKKCKK